MTIRKLSAKQHGNMSCRAESFRGEFSQRVFCFAANRRTGFARFVGFKQTNSRNRADCRPAGQFRRTVLPANRFQQPGESRSSKPDKRPKRRRKPVRTEPAKHAGQTRFQKTSSDFPETETGAAETFAEPFAEPFAAALFRAVLFPAAAPVTDTTFPSLRETTESHASTKPAS